MDSIGPLPPPLIDDPLRPATQTLVETWKSGQIIRASVVSGSQNGQATLNVGGNLILAKTGVSLQPAQALQLEVTRLATLAVLQLIDITGKPTPLTLTLPPQPDQWRSGQQLDADLIAITERRRGALLDIIGNRINAQLSQPAVQISELSIGQTLKLQVINPGMLTALRILKTDTPEKGIEKNTIEQALRNTLPRQTPLSPLLANLALIARYDPTNPLPLLPRPILDAVRNLIAHLPAVPELATPDGLKQAIRQSGLFLEAHLAQTVQSSPVTTALPANIALDFKGGLLGLLILLLTTTHSSPQSNPPPTDTPPAPLPAPGALLRTQNRAQATLSPQMTQPQALLELLRHTEGGLARLQLTQLLSSNTDDEGRRSWVIELPVRQDERIDLIQLRIEKKKSANNTRQAARWSINLTFDLEELGTVEARVQLTNGIISSTFWTRQEATTALIRENLHTLHTRLREAGLNIGTLAAHEGQPPQDNPATFPPAQALLDVQA